MNTDVLLIIEDNLTAKSLASFLLRHGLRPKIASNAGFAQKFCETNEFSLVVCDIHFKNETAINFLPRLNDIKTRGVPVFLIAGYSDAALIREAEYAGYTNLIFKPFDYSIIFDHLSKHVQLCKVSESSVIPGGAPPSPIKRFFYNALSSQWNPIKEIKWNEKVGLDHSRSVAMANILSPIIMGEYSAFNGIPQRIIAFSNSEVKQYLAVQLVDETRHAEAFELYLERIDAVDAYKKAWRNIKVVRYFNEMKKLTSCEEWITGLLVTEVTAHTLLAQYSNNVNCRLSSHLFNMIIADEARHIGFVTHYLKQLHRDTSIADREHIEKISERILSLTQLMLHFYKPSLQAFNLCPDLLYGQIRADVNQRMASLFTNADIT